MPQSKPCQRPGNFCRSWPRGGDEVPDRYSSSYSPFESKCARGTQRPPQLRDGLWGHLDDTFSKILSEHEVHQTHPRNQCNTITAYSAKKMLELHRLPEIWVWSSFIQAASDKPKRANNVVKRHTSTSGAVIRKRTSLYSDSRCPLCRAKTALFVDSGGAVRLKV